MRDVLIVEDDLRVCDFIRRTLSRGGIPHRTALSGRRALFQAGQTWPGLVVLDLTLSGVMDGWQVWDALRDMADGRPLDVVVLTGDDDPTIREQAQMRRAVGLVRKPVHPADLLDLVSRVLIPD